MTNWELLNKELNYFGIYLVDNKRCYLFSDGENKKYYIILKLMKNINKQIEEQKNIFIYLIKEMSKSLQETSFNNNIVDEKLIKLFIFSIKDMMKFFLCFEEEEVINYYNIFKCAVDRDILSFSKKQICDIPDYKISIDWVFRNINKLMYIYKLLIVYSSGKIENIDKIKMARTVQGPYSNLDLPMEERVFPFGDELDERTKARQKQRRYKRGLENTEKGSFVGEGYYWRELRNEPFSWANRKWDDPYPSRSSLSGI